MKYETPISLRQAINDRLQTIARKEKIPTIRLRRHLAFERLLARLFQAPSPWALKGGYAMELRFQQARTTRDIDLVVEEKHLVTAGHHDLSDAIYTHLIKALAKDLGDFFSFEVRRESLVLDDLNYIGVARFHIKANLGERLFAEFDVDLGAGDVRLWPFEELTSRNLLSFTGVTDCPPFPSIPAEQHFAEKVHAYSLPRGKRTNTRIKDMIDMVLLAQKGKMNNAKVADALHKTFERRNTHPLPEALPEPPEAWADKFAELAAECKLGLSFEEAFRLVRDYYSNLLCLS